MTSLREVMERIFGRNPAKPDLPDPNFDYRVFWTKQAMEWTAERREDLLTAIGTLKEKTDLSASPDDRRYHLEGLEDERYSASSLMALETVLRAMLNK